MTLNLNDFSIGPVSSDEDWGAITKHFSLVKQLDAFGVEKIRYDRDFNVLANQLQISSHSKTRQLAFQSFVGLHYCVDSIVPECVVQLTSSNESPCSKLVADAIEKDLPVISYVINDSFANESIRCFVKMPNKKWLGSDTVKNLYKNDYELITKTLPSFRNTALLNPLERPLWNQAFIVRYLNHIKHVNHQPDHALNSGEKVAYIIKHGSIIAELCGWARHNKFSKSNSSRDKKRVVFYSARFKDKNAYLCLDLEKSDFHFELCDYRGKHIGEYNWDGEKTEDGRSDHDIKV